MIKGNSPTRGSDRIWLIAIGAAVSVGAAVRLWAALQWRMNFDSDEAIFALMARHISQGKFTPVMYGTEYLGSFESVLSAIAIAIGGQGVPVLRFSSLALGVGFLALAAVYVWDHWGPRVAVIAASFLAFPGIHVLEWIFSPIGEYGVMLASGMAILILFDRVNWAATSRPLTLLTMGILAGLGLWSNQMTIVFLAAGIVPAVMGSNEWVSSRRWLASRVDRVTGGRTSFVFGSVTIILIFLGAAAFFVSGCAPPWRFTKVQTLARATLGVVLVGSALFLLLHSRARRRKLHEGGLFGLGVVFGYSPLWVSWLLTDLSPVTAIHRSCPTGIVSRGILMVEKMLPALWGVPALAELQVMRWWLVIVWGIIILCVTGALVWFGVSRWQTVKKAWTLEPLSPMDQPDLTLMILFAGPILLSLLGSNTVDIYSVRHLIIAWLASTIVFGLALSRLLDRRKKGGFAVACLWIGWIAFGVLSAANGNWRVKFTTYPPGAVDQLVATLSSHRVDSGYADYWGAYTLDYLSGERVKIAPYDGTDRYPAYSTYVRQQGRLAFIFPGSRSPDSGRGINGLVSFLRLPNNVSGEGPAKGDILEDLNRARLEAVETVGPWEVWIVSK